MQNAAGRLREARLAEGGTVGVLVEGRTSLAGVWAGPDSQGTQSTTAGQRILGGRTQRQKTGIVPWTTDQGKAHFLDWFFPEQMAPSMRFSGFVEQREKASSITRVHCAGYIPEGPGLSPRRDETEGAEPGT